MRDRITLPVALQIVVDDIGWFNGWDHRCIDGPSRTGIPRMHAPEDYTMLGALGKELGQVINCPLVLGEWDIKNRLRGMPHATNDEQGWDNASRIDMDLARRCFEAMESEEYLEYAFHGLMHGYWNDGINLADQEFSYPRSLDYKTKFAPESWLIPVDNDYLESHVETFFKIYEDWGFCKKIRSFTSPSSVQGGIEDNRHMTEIMKKYGMLYWSNNWREVKTLCEVIDGVIFINKGFSNASLHWAAYDVDPDEVADYSFDRNDGVTYAEKSVFDVHWPNFLAYNPKKNILNLPAWVRYFKRQAEIFGVMLSKDIAFAASQAVYRRYAVCTPREDGLVIDLEKVDAAGALGLSQTFYVSAKDPLTPSACEGARLALCEKHDGFSTYSLQRTGEGRVVLRF